MIDFIQVGDYKTGTSWLQKNFYPVHPEINYLGGPFKNNDLERLFHDLIDSRDLDYNAKQLKGNISDLLFDMPSQMVTGICREVFSCTDFITGENAKRNAERLFNIFGNVKIIYIIREQTNMIKSIYSQYLKMGGTLPIKAFIFDPIISKGLIERVKWHKQIKMYIDIFGEKNVYIGLFEKFKYDKQSFINDICKHLDIMPFQINNDNIIENKGLTIAGALVCRIGNRYFRSNYNNSNRNMIPAKFIKLITSKKKLYQLIEDKENRNIYKYGEDGFAQRIYDTFPTQNRAVTKHDYESIVYGMHPKFGSIKRCAIYQDPDSLKRNLNLYIIAEDRRGYLTTSNDTIKRNLKTGLMNYKLIKDTIDILA